MGVGDPSLGPVQHPLVASVPEKNRKTFEVLGANLIFQPNKFCMVCVANMIIHQVFNELV